MFTIESILRPHIKNLHKYISARDEFPGKADIYLDANENAHGSPLDENFNRYPDPMQWELKEKISGIKGVPSHNIFLGNGSHEIIDLLYRLVCNPGVDNVIIAPPAYSMYEAAAHINDIFVKKVPLTRHFQLDLEAISEVVDEHTKLMFLCSPNSPNGNSLHREDIEIILNNFNGLVVIDEAFINFSRQRSFIPELTEYPNLVVMQTLSKAWGLAGLRLGMAFASAEIIEVLTRIKMPYNISVPTQQLAIKALNNTEQVNRWTKETVAEREKLAESLKKLDFVLEVFPSDANFLMVRVKDAKAVYQFLLEHGIVVRDRSKHILCEGCLGITIGTMEENFRLMNTLSMFRDAQ